MNVIITLFVIYIIFRLSVRWLFPWLLKRYIKRVQQRFNEQNGYSTADDFQNQNKKNPKVTINYPGRKKHFEVNDIEYTDYEEIKEK